jgi:DNA-binding response OmpR family regulator
VSIDVTNRAYNDKRHIFVIEDNELLVKMYRSIFGAMGFDVIHASTKADARPLFETSQPDLFIVDDDGSGVEAMREILACNGFAHVPIIATVSHTSQKVVGDLHAAGIASVVTKPLQISSFAALVKRYLRGAADRRSAVVIPTYEPA